MIKKFTGTLVLDWKKGTFKHYKRKNYKLSPYQIPFEVNLNLEIPEQPIHTIKADIKLSDTKINEIFVEELTK